MTTTTFIVEITIGGAAADAASALEAALDAGVLQDHINEALCPAAGDIDTVDFDAGDDVLLDALGVESVVVTGTKTP